MSEVIDEIAFNRQVESNNLDCFDRDKELEQYEIWRLMRNWHGPGLTLADLQHFKTRIEAQTGIKTPRLVYRSKKAIVEWFQANCSLFASIIENSKRVSKVKRPLCKARQLNRMKKKEEMKRRPYIQKRRYNASPSPKETQTTFNSSNISENFEEEMNPGNYPVFDFSLFNDFEDTI